MRDVSGSTSTSSTSLNPALAFHDGAPFQLDRGAAWRYFTQPGEVFEVSGQWYLTSPEAVHFAHQHHEIFSSAKVFENGLCPVPLIPIGVDRPAHSRYRRVLDPMFAPRVIDRLEDSLRAQVGELIDRFASVGSCEVMRDSRRSLPDQGLHDDVRIAPRGLRHTAGLDQGHS